MPDEPQSDQPATKEVNQPTAPQSPPIEPKTEETVPTEPEIENKSEPPTPTPIENPPEEPKIITKEIIKEVPVTNPEEIQKAVEEKMKSALKDKLSMANQKRLQRKQKNLEKILVLAQKGQLTNQRVRDLLQVSQTTATRYLTELVKSGKLKISKKSNFTFYNL